MTFHFPSLHEEVIRAQPDLVFKHGFDWLIRYDNGISHGNTSMHAILRLRRASQYPDMTAPVCWEHPRRSKYRSSGDFVALSGHQKVDFSSRATQQLLERIRLYGQLLTLQNTAGKDQE